MEIGGKGLFTKEIEEALLDGRIDCAVHSLKDMPAELPPGLILAATPEREDPRDAFISHVAERLEDLPKGARLGTASLRRQAQALHVRPDLEIVMLRGNVDTRLAKLERGEADAILLADDLSRLLAARALALRTRKIIKENFAWSIGYNLLVLPLAASGWLPPYLAAAGMSLSSLIVVTNSMRLNR